VFAQENKIKKAEEEFSNYDYIDARKIYLSVVEDGYQSAQVFEKLGDTYYFNSEYAEANTWYGKLMDNYPDQVRPEYYFRTAQTLKSVGKYEESKEMMEKFKLSSPSNLASSQLNNWQTFENLTNSEGKNFKVTNITSEMAGSDFGPAFQKHRRKQSP
jgi:tetratricopeptide (TPR) repeat protein